MIRTACSSTNYSIELKKSFATDIRAFKYYIEAIEGSSAEDWSSLDIWKGWDLIGVHRVHLIGNSQ